MDNATMVELFAYCPICKTELLPHLLFTKSGARFCPNHGDFFIQRLRDEKPTVVFRMFDQYARDAETHAKRDIPLGRPSYKIRCNETGVIFSSLKDAAKEMGLWRSSLSKHINGQRSHVSGYTFTRLQ